MVANAHQEREPQQIYIFDMVYMAAVSAFPLALISLPFLELWAHDLPFVKRCLGKHKDQPIKIPILWKIGLAFYFLFVMFHFMISLRTRKNLKKLQDQHFKNLPSKNALTFRDTEILCLISNIHVLIQGTMRIMFFSEVLPLDLTLLLTNVVQFVFTNILIALIFPMYIILKTRRYLPRLWSDQAPIILQNNDFYAVRLSQVNQELEMAEAPRF